MNRTLRRPMFRIGGVAEGITSGLQPRQGYAQKPSRVLPDDLRKRKISDVLSGDTTLGEAQDLSRALAYKPRGTNIYDFMTEMGLDLVSRPKSGNIFQQIATSAKEPYQRFMERKQSAAEQGYGSESSMFKTLIEAGATASGEGKTYAHRDRYAMIKGNVEEQLGLRDELSNPETTDERASEIKDEIRVLRDAISDPEFSKAMLKFIGDDQEMRTLKLMVKNQVAAELDIPSDFGFEQGEKGKEFYNAYQKRMTEILGDYAIGIAPTFEEGGRVGYQIGGDVMPGQPMQAQAAGPTDQGPAPEDMAGITYEELRARLPQEVSDDIVRLLANSAEALEDFAMIQTEQDINTFNKKYGVNLVLPSEG